MGAVISVHNGYIEATVDRLKGASIVFDMPTVTGTENLMMAATLAEGETILENAAREPEIVDLAECLIKMGAIIEGAGTDRIRIIGQNRLSGATHQVMPDRIEAGTFLCAAAAAGAACARAACRRRSESRCACPSPILEVFAGPDIRACW